MKGVSARKGSDIVEILCGSPILTTQDSRISKKLDEEIASWKAQEIGQIQYLVLDATYETGRTGHKASKATLLVAFGIDYDCQRHILDEDVAYNEAEINWRRFLKGLIKWGWHVLRMIRSGNCSGLRTTIHAVFPGILWQRCQFHLHQNARYYVSNKEEIPEVHSDIRCIFYAPDLKNTERYLQQLVKNIGSVSPGFLTSLKIICSKN